MRIKKWIDIEQEIDVDISVEDITVALAEDPDTTTRIMNGLNQAAEFMKGISDEMIGEMRVAQRIIIGQFLEKQADRYK